MARPRHEGPTPGELEILRILWRRGSSTVAEVRDALERRPRPAYTSVMSLLGVMFRKRLVDRRRRGKPYFYTARVGRKATLRRMTKDLLDRAFGGAAAELLTHALEAGDVSDGDLAEMQRLIRRKRAEAGEGGNDK